MDEKEYIERDAAKAAFCRYMGFTSPRAALASDIIFDKIPAADVSPVVHSRWEICSDGYYPFCMACKREPPGREMTDFCPHCGASMREKEAANG